MSGAPKAARTLGGLPRERALHGKEPFGPPQEAFPYPNPAPTADRRCAAPRRWPAWPRRSAWRRRRWPTPRRPAQPAAHHAVVADAASPAGPSSAQLLAAIEQTTQHSSSRLPASHPGTPSGRVTRCPRSPDVPTTTRTHGRCCTGPTTAGSTGRTSSSPGRFCGSRSSPPGSPVRLASSARLRRRPAQAAAPSAGPADCDRPGRGARPATPAARRADRSASA